MSKSITLNSRTYVDDVDFEPGTYKYVGNFFDLFTDLLAELELRGIVHAVLSVNGIVPDGDGNVIVTAAGGGGGASLAVVNSPEEENTVGQQGFVFIVRNDLLSGAPAPDSTAPVITGFDIPTTANSLTFDITTFTASDAVGVTGYKITESSTPPTAGSGGWSGSVPTTYTASNAGYHTLYAWAKDAAGNISAGVSASITITLADAIAPTITAFTMPASSSSLTVAISSFTASDNVGVTGYLVKEGSTAPTLSDPAWSATAQTQFTFGGTGSRTAYAWVRDAAGNISSSASAAVTITAADVTAPTVTAFTMPSTAVSLTVNVSSFTASDNVGVTGYMITESATPPAAGAGGWSGSAPTTYTAGSAGSKTLYPWAKDAAGNVSAVFGTPRTVVISAPAAPTGHSTVAGDAKITLHPGTSTGATSYKYYLKAGSDPTKVSYDATGTATDAQDITSLSNGTAYHVGYTAVSSAGESDLSTIDTATPAAAGPTITASGSYGTDTPDKAFDGNASTNWTPDALPAWIKAQYPTAQTFTQVIVSAWSAFFTEQMVKDYVIEASNDNSNWTPLKSGTIANTSGDKTLTWANSTAYLYYRFTVSSNWGTTSGIVQLTFS